MKELNQQQTQAIIKAVSEMDGWTEITSDLKYGFPPKADGYYPSLALPPYTTSRDAIFPVIIKWCGDLTGRKVMILENLPAPWLIENTPLEFCIAMLKAAGKLPEGICE
jgi:hypothetical protein